jgi:hypothetical protein
MKVILLLTILFTPAFAVAQATGGVVAGQVRSAAGIGLSGLRVAAVDAAESGAGRNESPVMVSLTQTDGSGNYRLENIPPGRYYIMTGLIDFPTYFPGSTSKNDATVVTVADRSLQSGMDFVLLSLFRVGGHVRYAPNERAGTEVTLQSNLRTLPPLRAAIGPDGAFQFAAVPVGNYVARVGTIRMPLGVDGDVVDLELKTPPSIEVTVRFKTDNDSPVPAASLRLTDVAEAYPQQNATNGSRLTLPAVEYRVSAYLTTGYSLKSMTHNSVDFLGFVDLSKDDKSEIVVTLISPTPAVEVRGQLAAAAGMITPTKVRISGPAIAAESTLDPKGEFTIENVLRGNYITYVQVALGEPFNSIGTRSNRTVSVGTRSIDVLENDVQNVKLALPALVVVVAGSGTMATPTWIAEGRIHATNEAGELFSSFVPPSILYATLLGGSGRSRNAGTATLDGEFRIELPKDSQGEWILELGLPPEGYYVKKISAGPLNLLREPLRLRASEKLQDLDIFIEFARISAP